MNLNPELLLRYNRPGPRYTSYPTAPAWKAEVPRSLWDEGLGRLRTPASVYVHVPFCEAQCSYCGCTMVVAGRQSAGDRYLDALARQVEGLPLPSDAVDVAWVHLGGGTPTWLSPDQLTRLYSILSSRFRPIQGVERSAEADPAVTTPAHLDALVGAGLNRLSLGIQSFDPAVLQAVNRPQSFEVVRSLAEKARELGLKQINLDLMYGLPHQNLESLKDTVMRTLSLRPERLAVFGYAHVPWLKSHQRKLPAEALPGPTERAALFLSAREMLLQAGYEAIGMDHFALPDDPLAAARREGRLGRSFMGYTTLFDSDMLGLGMSAISDFGDRYLQQHSKLAPWLRAAERGEVALEKGALLSPEDQLRREVITRLMCNFDLPYAPIEARHHLDFARHFQAELEGMDELESAGLVERRTDRLHIPEGSHLLVRNVAMVFDQYLPSPTQGPRFSQTV